MRELQIDKKKLVRVDIVYNNGKIREVLQEIRGKVEEYIRKEKRILLFRDWNARIGKWQISEEGRR